MVGAVSLAVHNNNNNNNNNNCYNTFMLNYIYIFFYQVFLYFFKR
jgi:hypothetical protein